MAFDIIDEVKKPLLIFIAVLLVISVLIAGKYLIPSSPKAQLAQEPAVSDAVKDCGSSLSQKGNNNTDGMDRSCFLEAYNSCTPAKITQEVIDPNDNPIKTSVFIDSKDGDRCRVSVHVDNKMTFPENDIYYCYSLAQGDLDNYHLKIDDCKDRKALFL